MATSKEYLNFISDQFSVIDSITLKPMNYEHI